jgi:SpoVK/Ycf46/Vps4 family AAA+-type ATPase
VGGEDLFVIGATNRPDLLDPALLPPHSFLHIKDPSTQHTGSLCDFPLSDENSYIYNPCASLCRVAARTCS